MGRKKRVEEAGDNVAVKVSPWLAALIDDIKRAYRMGSARRVLDAVAGPVLEQKAADGRAKLAGAAKPAKGE